MKPRPSMEALARWWAAALLAWRRFLGAWPERGRRLPSRRSWRQGDADHVLDQAADRLGLARQDHIDLTVLRGQRGDLEIEIEIRRIPWGHGETRFEQTVTVRAPTAFAPGSMIAEPRDRRRGPDGVRTRDGHFDAAMRVFGSEDIGLALLSSGLRAAIVGNGGHWTIDPTQLRWKALRAPNFLVPAVERVVELVEEAVARGPDLVSGLIHRVRSDLHPGVRRRAFAVLWERYAEDPRARETALAATQDRLAQLRLEAALVLGEDGRPTLLGLAETPSTPRGLRRIAAQHLPSGDPDIEARLVERLEDKNLERAVVAAELLGLLGSPDNLRRLEPLTGRFTARAPLRKAAREAMARIVTRHAHLDAGHLSLASPSDPTGALSPAPGSDPEIPGAEESDTGSEPSRISHAESIP